MTLIIILHVLLCVFLISVILLQPGKSDSGIGFGSTSQSIFGSRGAGNILTRTTAFVAFFFLITSFFLARQRVVETTGTVVKPPTETSAPAAAPTAPSTAPSAEKKAEEPAADAKKK